MTDQKPFSTLLAKRIRHRIVDRSSADGRVTRTAPVRAVTDELELLHKTWDLRFLEQTSSRPGTGWLVVAARRFLRIALFPMLARQSEYNAASMRLLASLTEQVKALSAELDASRAARAFPLRRTVATSTDGARPTVDLLRLEDRFRGSEEDIVERQRPYLRHFTGAAPVLDIGCGRGEFLEVLRGEGIDAYGVDLDESMVGHSRAKNLRVVHGDGLEHLASLEDGALGGIFAAQVIEHLDVAQVITLADLCAAKLRPGGVVLLESVNPRVALALQNFYIDFTHIRPYDPEAVAWLLESKGFTNLSVEYSMPSAELHVPPLQAAGVDAAAFDDAIARMNDVLYGPRAYAVVATKRV